MRPKSTPTSAPVDVVYTWVDGRWPGYQEAIRAAGADIDASRWTDNWSLFKYSLRSVSRYLPFVRRIHLFTARPQVPPWLDPRHPKIRLHHHDEVIEPEYLPTFNSNAIEAHLHRLPGLAERFLYMNDDYLVLKKAAVSDFVTAEGRMRHFNNVHYDLERRILGLDWFDAPGGIPLGGLIAGQRAVESHVPMLLTKSHYAAMQRRFAREFEAIKASRFERACEFPSLYYLRHLRAEGLLVDVPWREFLAERLQFGVRNELRWRLLLDLLLSATQVGRRPRFMCLNDNMSRHDDALLNSVVSRFLKRNFRDKAPWER